MSAMSRAGLRILIVAEHASAAFGGEAFLPLQYFRVLRARGIEAWLVCHGRVEQEIRDAFPDQQDRLHFIRDSPVHRALWAISRPLPRRLEGVTFGAVSHLLTQLLERRIVRKLVEEKCIDDVHEPIPVSPRQPSAMFGVGAPVVIGPMNGDMDYPPAYAHMEGRAQRIAMRAARSAANFMNRLIPGKRRAALLLVANPRTRAALPASVSRVPVVELVENGVDLSRFAAGARAARREGEPVRFAFVGRLVDWKAVDVLLDAFARVERPDGLVLEIFGDGEDRAALERQCESLGLSARVRFHGFVPQTEVAKRLPEMDALVLPSLRECGGAVVLEAMALGLPVIATRWGGPADYLDETCGILVEPSARAEFMRDLASAMSSLAADGAKRRALGEAGRRKVLELYDWERKVDRMLELYGEVVSGR
jgi:glycosyltransferase involved in cell wall biosynthesis